MLGRAKEHKFAFPAINCVGSESVNAAIKGFADAGSDGIIQFSTGGAEFASGLGVKDMVTGAVALAEFAHVVAAKYDVTIALHTDHCPKDKLDTYVRPLLAVSQERVDAGKNPLFQSHMWDGSAVPIDENLEIARDLLAKAAAARIILEIEIGVVGGEEDGVEAEINDKLYTSNGQGSTVEWELESGGISFAAYATIAGGVVISTGITPNQINRFRKKSLDQRPFFTALGRAINDNGGDFQSIVYRCRADNPRSRDRRGRRRGGRRRR
jgi:fructose-bisphosphate aldolase class II